MKTLMILATCAVLAAGMGCGMDFQGSFTMTPRATGCVETERPSCAPTIYEAPRCAPPVVVVERRPCPTVVFHRAPVVVRHDRHLACR